MLEGTAVLWEEFQSTLPVRGATKPGIQRIRIKGISIHAPREGSDRPDGEGRDQPDDFNPRSP